MTDYKEGFMNWIKGEIGKLVGAACRRNDSEADPRQFKRDGAADTGARGL